MLDCFYHRYEEDLMFLSVFKYAFRNILRTKMRSTFTVLSITLLIILYTVLTSVGDTFTSQINKVLNQQNIDIVIQSRYASTPVTSSVDTKRLKQITTLDEVDSFEAMLIGRKRIEANALIFVLGISKFQAIAQRLGMKIIEGRPSSADHNEVVIGEKMAQLYGLSIGSEIRLSSDKSYKVVGIFSSWLNFLNAGVMIDLKAAQTLLGKKQKISLLFLSLKDKTSTQGFVDNINKKYPDLRAIDSSELPNYLGPIKSIFYFSKIVSFLTLIIAIAVMLNTFVLSISERTREIGILRAIGWSRKMVSLVFLYESLLLSFSGGILGYLLAFPIMYFLQKNYVSISMYLPTTPNLHVLFSVALMCFVIAILSVAFPAFYATKITIAKAMRYE